MLTTASVEWGRVYGLMDNNASNPFGPDYNFVWIGYCDGSSETSDVSGPVAGPNNSTLWFRGRAILDANLAELEASYGFLSTATEVIVSGTSAGGIATYLHASFIKSLVQKTARVVAVPDAGFFLAHETYGRPGVFAWFETLTAAYALWNSTLRGDASACVGALGAGAASCLFPRYLYPFLSSLDGIFVVQSMYDTANLGICYGLSCDLPAGKCSAEQHAAIDAYALEIRDEVLTAVAHFGDRDGFFLSSCFQHEESCRAQDWFGITVGGQTPNSTLATWYTSSGADPGARRVDAAWPGDGSCMPDGFTHGAC